MKRQKLQVLNDKLGSVTMMSVGMLPVFLFIAGMIILIILFWASYVRLLTAAEIGALTVIKSQQTAEDKQLIVQLSQTVEGGAVSPSYYITEPVRQAVVQNGADPHGEIICTSKEIQVIAYHKVFDRWEIKAQGRAIKEVSSPCNWRKISY